METSTETSSTHSLASAAVRGAPTDARHDSEVPEVDLLSPYTIRGVTLRNRLVMAPMCQYSAQDGMANDWHLVHLGSRAVGGVGLVMVEATAVAPEGRISPGDLGLWHDGQIEPLARIVRFIQAQGGAAAIQLAHAGRKASCAAPWLGRHQLAPGEAGGWPVVGASPVPFHDHDPAPHELDLAGIDDVVQAFAAAAGRALEAGFDVLEIHAAHGYLMHQFLSPLSNKRNDEYGGSLENRMRLLLRVASRVRESIPDSVPLFVRISSTDWVEGGWDVDQSVELARRLKAAGVDLIDVSSGGSVPTARIPLAKGYQVPACSRIHAEAQVPTGAVGLITEVQHANDIITGGDADLVFLGRELLREPYWMLKAEQVLGAEPNWSTQYGYAVKRPRI